VLAVLADVAEEEPTELAIGPRLLDELHVPPGCMAEAARVVVARAEEIEVIGGEAVPLLARNLARLAADAERGVGEKAVLHRPPPPVRLIQTARRAVDDRPTRHLLLFLSTYSTIRG
jgi:hypothetical protein